MKCFMPLVPIGSIDSDHDIDQKNCFEGPSRSDTMAKILFPTNYEYYLAAFTGHGPPAGSQNLQT